ncbi:hypothetical protein [Caballeronia sp. LZ035]|uniref:hypothetical protein n=1 Tax=Caballeronia sp. LZ035 TaxID=3038568 RepID=UPI0028661874|nr:hypothetical protein [Caballeronia sp. LZ035]MDR5762963.1 hypothetical protein [Caballeronia sp. LZ035]
MNRNEILIAAQSLNLQFSEASVSNSQTGHQLTGLMVAMESLGVDDRLRNDFLVVESLIVLKRYQQALDRFRRALLDAYFRPPPPAPFSMK